MKLPCARVFLWVFPVILPLHHAGAEIFKIGSGESTTIFVNDFDTKGIDQSVGNRITSIIARKLAESREYSSSQIYTTQTISLLKKDLEKELRENKDCNAEACQIKISKALDADLTISGNVLLHNDGTKLIINVLALSMSPKGDAVTNNFSLECYEDELDYFAEEIIKKSANKDYAVNYAGIKKIAKSELDVVKIKFGKLEEIKKTDTGTAGSDDRLFESNRFIKSHGAKIKKADALIEKGKYEKGLEIYREIFLKTSKDTKAESQNAQMEALNFLKKRIEFTAKSRAIKDLNEITVKINKTNPLDESAQKDMLTDLSDIKNEYMNHLIFSAALPAKKAKKKESPAEENSFLDRYSKQLEKAEFLAEERQYEDALKIYDEVAAGLEGTSEKKIKKDEDNFRKATKNIKELSDSVRKEKNYRESSSERTRQSLTFSDSLIKEIDLRSTALELNLQKIIYPRGEKIFQSLKFEEAYSLYNNIHESLKPMQQTDEVVLFSKLVNAKKEAIVQSGNSYFENRISTALGLASTYYYAATRKKSSKESGWNSRAKEGYKIIKETRMMIVSNSRFISPAALKIFNDQISAIQNNLYIPDRYKPKEIVSIDQEKRNLELAKRKKTVKERREKTKVVKYKPRKRLHFNYSYTKTNVKESLRRPGASIENTPLRLAVKAAFWGGVFKTGDNYRLASKSRKDYLRDPNELFVWMILNQTQGNILSNFNIYSGNHFTFLWYIDSLKNRFAYEKAVQKYNSSVRFVSSVYGFSLFLSLFSGITYSAFEQKTQGVPVAKIPDSNVILTFNSSPDINFSEIPGRETGQRAELQLEYRF